jgi:serine/threonine-protein kinase
MTLEPGTVLEEKYRIVRRIGEGGMGAVYEGGNTRIRRRVAIKVLHAHEASKDDVVQRFEREAQAAGRIGSDHIVEVLDLGSLPSGERFLVMEYLDGEDVTTRIRRFGKLAPAEAAPLLHQALEGLGAAHAAGIIHRDLKPDNIFILGRHAGHVDFVKLLDFGVSKFTASDDEMSMTRTGAVMGTPEYMSPEQAKGNAVDSRSDLYSIGVVAYQMVTGRVPFSAGSFNELLFKIVLERPEALENIAPDLESTFAEVVYRAMAREPDARFQTAAEFQEALRPWLTLAPAGPPSLGQGALSIRAAVSVNFVPDSSENLTRVAVDSSVVSGALKTPGAGTPLDHSHAPLAVSSPPSAGTRSLKLALGGVALGLVGAVVAGLRVLGSDGPPAGATANASAPTHAVTAAHRQVAASASATSLVESPSTTSGAEGPAPSAVPSAAAAPASPGAVPHPSGGSASKVPGKPGPQPPTSGAARSKASSTTDANGRKIKTDL